LQIKAKRHDVGVVHIGGSSNRKNGFQTKGGRKKSWGSAGTDSLQLSIALTAKKNHEKGTPGDGTLKSASGKSYKGHFREGKEGENVLISKRRCKRPKTSESRGQSVHALIKEKKNRIRLIEKEEQSPRAAERKKRGRGPLDLQKKVLSNTKSLINKGGPAVENKGGGRCGDTRVSPILQPKRNLKISDLPVKFFCRRGRRRTDFSPRFVKRKKAVGWGGPGRGEKYNNTTEIRGENHGTAKPSF